MKQNAVPTEKSKRNRLRLFVVLSVVFALLLAGVIFAFLRQDVIYRVKSRLHAVTANAQLEETAVETQTVSMQDLLGDERVTYVQSLLLVNGSHPLPDGFSAEISPYKDTDVLMNVCIQDSYAALASAIKERFGQTLYVRSSYRTAEEQQAELEADSEFAAPVGTSEHQTGLALDVYFPYYAGMAILKTEAGRWMNDHAWEYGFIVRYPVYGTDETGFPFEPWHLRYVGAPHAEILSEGCLTLEEYIPMLEPGAFYCHGDYLFSRQEGDIDIVTVPVHFRSAVISEDNADGWILTFLV